MHLTEAGMGVLERVRPLAIEGELPGNVFRAFSKLSGKARQGDALDKINSMPPDEVYAALRTKLPYEETRGYIVNAVAAKKRYAAM
jgi:membrane-bound lytic murein transglycosylase C